jgi:hypothetical protein
VRFPFVQKYVCCYLRNRRLSENLFSTGGRMTQGLGFGFILVVRLVPESVKRVTAPMDGLSQHVQLEEHGTACDMPPHRLIVYDLSLEKSLLQVIIQRRRLGDFADDEIYGSSGQLTKDCRNDKIHLELQLRNQQLEVKVNRSA